MGDRFAIEIVSSRTYNKRSEMVTRMELQDRYQQREPLHQPWGSSRSTQLKQRLAGFRSKKLGYRHLGAREHQNAPT